MAISQMLDQLSRHLQDLQKKLIDTRKELHEKQQGATLTPYQMLDLLQNSEKFSWMQPMTTLIVEIDTLVDDKNLDPNSQHLQQFIARTRSLVFDGVDKAFKDAFEEGSAVNAELLESHQRLSYFLESIPDTRS